MSKGLTQAFCECRGECGYMHGDARHRDGCERCMALNSGPHPITGSRVVTAMCWSCHFCYGARIHAQTRKRLRLEAMKSQGQLGLYSIDKEGS